jgi:transcriptional regulator with XRE-family HTH domain
MRTVKIDGEKLKRLRAAKGWSVEDLADKAECTIRTIGTAEKGGPSYLHTVNAIAAALGIQCSELMADNPAPEPERQEPRFEVEFKVSIPYEKFESKQLATLIDLLQRLLGGDMEPGIPKGGSTIIPVMMTKEQVEKLVEILPDFQAHVIAMMQKNAGVMTAQEVYEMQSAIDPIVDSLIDISIPDDPAFPEYRGLTIAVNK